MSPDEPKVTGSAGEDDRVTKQRGEFFAADMAPMITATIYPSAILRAPDDVSREHEFDEFVADLRRVAGRLRA